MESRILGRRFHLVSSVASLTPVIRRLLILSLLCRQSLLFILTAAASVSPDQNHTKFDHNDVEWTNATDGASSVKCLVQQSMKFTNESLGGHQLTLSFGHGIYILGFIGILIVLKSLLTKIMMVENKPEDSEYIMSMCETAAMYKITLQRSTDSNNSPLTPPNSPCTLQPPDTSTPVFYSGTRRYSLSDLNGGRLYYGESCPFSSPEGSTKCLV